MKYRSSKLSPVQQAKAAVILPENTHGCNIFFENADEMQRAYDIVRLAQFGCAGGELRCLRMLLGKLQSMIEDPYRFEMRDKVTRRLFKPKKGEIAIECTRGQTQYLRDEVTLRGIRWASKHSQKSSFYVKEDKQEDLVSQLQDLWYEDSLPANRRVISTTARKLTVNGSPAKINHDDDVASMDRLKCLTYVLDKIGVEYNGSARTVGDMVSMKHAGDVISELKILASMVRGSNRICWSLISKIERLRGVKNQQDQWINYQVETALMSNQAELTFDSDGPSAADLQAIEEEMTLDLFEEEPQPVAVALEENEVQKVEIQADDDEGPNCFFAEEESWDQYDEDDDFEDDVDLEWFVYGSIPNCLSLLEIPDEDERVHSLDGDDISFSSEDNRNAWCQELKGMIEDLVEFDELEQAEADLCFNEVLAIENSSSLV